MKDFHFSILFIGNAAHKDDVLPEWQGIVMPELVLCRGTFDTYTLCAGTNDLREAITDKVAFAELNIGTGQFTPMMSLPLTSSEDRLTSREQKNEDLSDLAVLPFKRVRTVVRELFDRWHNASRVPLNLLAFDIVPEGMPAGEVFRAQIGSNGKVFVHRIALTGAR